MALGRAFQGLGDDLMNLYHMEVEKRERMRRDAIEQDRYNRDVERQNKLDQVAADERGFNRAQVLRNTLGPGETQDVNTGELLSKYGFATELDQAQENETAGTVNQTNPRRFSLPANFIEKAQQEDQELQRQAAERQKQEFARQEAERNAEAAFMRGLPADVRQRAESHKFLGGFDPTMPTWEKRNEIEHQQGLARIQAGQTDQIDPKLRQTLQILQLTKPDAQANPEAYEMWSRSAQEQLQKYLGQDQETPMGPFHDLGNLPAATEEEPGFFSNMGSSIQNFLGPEPQRVQVPLGQDPFLEDEGSFDLDLLSILEEIQKRGRPNPRDPKYFRK